MADTIDSLLNEAFLLGSQQQNPDEDNIIDQGQNIILEDQVNLSNDRLSASLDDILKDAVQQPYDPNQFNFSDPTPEFDTRPIFKPDPDQLPSPQTKQTAQGILPPIIYNAVDTYLFQPFERVYNNIGSGINNFNHSFYSGLSEVAKVVEETTGAKHNASDFLATVASEIKKRGITPESEHWADKVVFMIGDMLPSAGLGVGAGVAAQTATRALTSANSVAPAVARFLGEGAYGAYEGLGRASAAGADLAEGAGEGAKNFALLELANSFGSRYGKAFQIGFSTSVAGGFAALAPGATKDDVIAASILGAAFAIPSRSTSGDYRVDLANIKKWVTKKRNEGVEPTPSGYIEENLPSSIEQASVSQLLDPFNKTKESPYEHVKNNIAKEIGDDPANITDDQIYTKMSEEMGPDAAAIFMDSLKKETDIYLNQKESSPEIVQIEKDGRKIEVTKAVSENIGRIEKNIEDVLIRRQELEKSLDKKATEVISSAFNKTKDAFLGKERRYEYALEDVPGGKNILMLRNIKNSATSISEFNIKQAFDDIGFTGKNKMNPELQKDFVLVSDALVNIDKLNREKEYTSAVDAVHYKKTGKHLSNQEQIDHYDYIVSDMKSKYGDIIIDRGDTGYSIKGDNDLSLRLEKYFGNFQKYLKNLETSGVITKDKYNSMKNIVYSPTQYLEFLKKELDFETDLQREALFGVKQLKTGKNEVNIDNPEYLLSGHIMRMDYILAKNDELNATYSFALKEPDNLVARTTPGIEGYGYEVKFKKDGEVTSLYFNDDFKDVHEMDSLFAYKYSNIVKAAQWITGTNIVKTAATGTLAPDFFITAIPRDIFFFNMSNHWKGQSNILPIAGAKAIKGIKDNFKEIRNNTEKAQEFILSGGASSTLANEMKRLTKNEKTARFIKRKSKGMQAWDKGVDALNYLNHTSEMAVRMHYADLVYNEGKNGLTYPEAVSEVSRMLDFKRRGVASDLIETGLPYFNVATQAIERFSRNKNQHKNKKLYYAKLSQWMAASAMMSYSSYWLFDLMGDEESKKTAIDTLNNVSYERRVRELVLPTGHFEKTADGDVVQSFISLKKEQFPFTVALDAIGMMTMDYLMQGKIPDKDVFKEVTSAATPYDIFNILPTYSAYLAATKNLDLRNQRLISDPNIPASQRVKNASELSKSVVGLLGDDTSVSPEGLDVAARSLGLTNSFLKGSYNIFDYVTGLDSGGFSDEARRDLTIAFAESPISSRIIKKTNQGNRLMRRLEKDSDALMTPQQKKVMIPVTNIIEKLKDGTITNNDALREARALPLKGYERKAVVEKISNFIKGEKEYEILSNKKYFKENGLNPGMKTSWRRYHALYSRVSDENAGEQAAQYVYDEFLSLQGDDPEMVNAVRKLGLFYLPERHRYSFSNKFRSLINKE